MQQDTPGGMMRMVRCGIFLILAALVFPKSTYAESPDLRWDAGGLNFELTSKDLRVTRAGSLIFSAKRMVDGEVQSVRDDAREEAKRIAELPAEEQKNAIDSPTLSWDAANSLKPLSIVGTWTSYEVQSGGYTGGAHPYAYAGYTACDLSRPIKKDDSSKCSGSLLDIFPEEQVVAALARDSFLSKRLKRQKFRTVAELVKAVGENSDCEFRFDENSLSSFAFHHLEGNKVAVRIGLSHGCEASRGKLTRLGILLPIPAKLADALGKADRREQGFLMKDAEAIGIVTYAASYSVEVKDLVLKMLKRGAK